MPPKKAPKAEVEEAKSKSPMRPKTTKAQDEQTEKPVVKKIKQKREESKSPTANKRVPAAIADKPPKPEETKSDNKRKASLAKPKEKSKSPSAPKQKKPAAAAPKEESKQVAKPKSAAKKKPATHEAPADLGPLPRRPPSGYQLFQRELVEKEKAERREGEPARAGPALFKAAGDAWALMDEAARAPYAERAAEAKEQHARLLDERAEKGYFTFEDGSKSTDPENASRVAPAKSKGAKDAETKKKKGSKGQKASDSDDEEEPVRQPKRPVPAYALFVKAWCAEHAGAGLTLAGAAWGELSDAEKERYQALHEKDRARHAEQTEMLKTKGYFLTEDGVKSTDLPAPARKKQKKAAKPGTDEDEEQEPVQKPRKSLQRAKKQKPPVIAAAPKKTDDAEDALDIISESSSV